MDLTLKYRTKGTNGLSAPKRQRIREDWALHRLHQPFSLVLSYLPIYANNATPTLKGLLKIQAFRTQRYPASC